MSTDPAGSAARLVTLTVGPVGRARPKRSVGDTAAPSVYLCSWAANGPTSPRALGPDEKPPEPVDLALSLSPEDAELVRRGELEPSVAFMQGRLKTAGDNGLLLEVLAWTATAPFHQALVQLAG